MRYTEAFYQPRKAAFALAILVGSEICLLPACSSPDTFRQHVRRLPATSCSQIPFHGPDIAGKQTHILQREEQPCQLQPVPPFRNIDQGAQNPRELMNEKKQNKEQFVMGETDNSIEEGFYFYF